jgi:hypothetical protein
MRIRIQSAKLMLILIRLCPYSNEIEKHFEKGRGQVGLFIFFYFIAA